MRSASHLAAILLAGLISFNVLAQEALPPAEPAQASPPPAAAPEAAPPPAPTAPEAPPPVAADPNAVPPPPAVPPAPHPRRFEQRRGPNFARPWPAPQPPVQLLPPGGMPGGPNPAWRRMTLRFPQGRPVKGAFLGVSASPAQPALQRQLQLKPGVGLVVDRVEQGSPAEQAGVKEFDVIHKLDDQLLVNPEQFSVLVRTYKPGDEVKVTVIREGKPQVLTAKLAEREFLSAGAGPFHLNLIGDVQQDGENVLRVVTQNPYAAGEGDVHFVAPGGEELRAAQVLVEDDQHKMSISSKAGKKQLRVEDKAGKIVFDGPIHTAEQLGKVPTDIRDKILDMGLQGLSLPGSEPQATPPQPGGKPTEDAAPAPGADGTPRPTPSTPDATPGQ